MKKLAVILTVLALLMFAEYRFIMCNLFPYYDEHGFLCIEFMGQIDSYYVEPFSEKPVPNTLEGWHDQSWRESLKN